VATKESSVDHVAVLIGAHSIAIYIYLKQSYTWIANENNYKVHRKIVGQNGV
jgi:hypothetical protein